MKSDDRTLEVAEGMDGTSFYHLRILEVDPFRSFCGRPVMHTTIPIEDWGSISEDAGAHWCTACAVHLPRTPTRAAGGAA